VALRHRRNYPVSSGQTVVAPLPVAEKDGLITGTVRAPGGTALAGATVVADGLGWQLGDLNLSTTSGDDGGFSIQLPHGHYLVRAALGADSDWINPVSLNVVVPEGGSVTGLELQFLQSDATISGTVTLHVTPIATFPHQRHANVYRYGYAFTAADGDGQPIEQQFNQDVLITFSYDEAELVRMGISEQRLKPAYFATTTDSWTFPESYVVDTVADVVAMQIDHFTGFALTGMTEYQVFLPLVLR